MKNHALHVRRAWAGRLAISFFILFAFAMLASVPYAATLMQSGRRKTDPSRQSPVPPSPTPSPEQAESESQPLRSSKAKNQNVVATFVVYEDDTVYLDGFFSSRDIIGATFFERLRQSPVVAVERGGRGNRKDARDRAKKERDAFVVLLQLEEDVTAVRNRDNRQTGHVDPRYLSIRLYVYAPGNGDLKFMETIYQRPYRESARIGGVRIPVPVSRPERYPGELQLEQAARDAADRVLSRFDIPRPPDN